jgi:hypothetical protein
VLHQTQSSVLHIKVSRMYIYLLFILGAPGELLAVHIICYTTGELAGELEEGIGEMSTYHWERRHIETLVHRITS